MEEERKESQVRPSAWRSWLVEEDGMCSALWALSSQQDGEWSLLAAQLLLCTPVLDQFELYEAQSGIKSGKFVAASFGLCAKTCVLSGMVLPVLLLTSIFIIYFYYYIIY